MTADLWTHQGFPQRPSILIAKFPYIEQDLQKNRLEAACSAWISTRYVSACEEELLDETVLLNPTAPG